MAEFVTVRNEFGEEKRVRKAAVPFFIDQGFRVLDSKGRVSAPATTAAAKTNTQKES